MRDRLLNHKNTTAAGGLTLLYAAWTWFGEPAPDVLLSYVQEMDNAKFLGLVALGVALLLAKDR